MRILIANVFFAPTAFGGATIVAERTALALKQSGHEVLVFSGNEMSDLGEGQLFRYATSGIDVVTARLARRSSPEREFSNPQVAASFGRILDAYRPEVVHFHATQLIGVECLEECFRRDIPVVVSLHDAWWLCERQFMIDGAGRPCGVEAITQAACEHCVPDPAWNKWRQEKSRALLGRAHVLLAPSDHWRDLMIRSGLPAEKTITSTNGIELPSPEWTRPESSGPIRFGFVGGIGPLKGSRLIVEALSGLQRIDYVLIAVDNTTIRGWSGMSQRDWPVPGEVQIIPGYGQHQLDDFFGSIDVLLFPSLGNESFSLTVREASSRGVWVIATAGGAVEEGLVAGINSTIIPRVADAAPLRDAIAAVLDDPDRFRRIVKPSPTIIGFRDQAAQLAQIYAELTRRTARQPAGLGAV